MTTAGDVGKALDGLESVAYDLALDMAKLYDAQIGTGGADLGQVKDIPNLNEQLAELQHTASQVNKIDAATKGQTTQTTRAVGQGA